MPARADQRLVDVSGIVVRSVYPGLGGLRDATARLDVAASNIANMPSQTYVPSHVVSRELPRGGVESVVLADGTGQGTDLATEMVGLMTARLAFSANLAALAATFETERSLLDIVA